MRILMVCLYIISTNVHAYKEATHEKISVHAVENSILGVENLQDGGELWYRLGLNYYANNRVFPRPDINISYKERKKCNKEPLCSIEELIRNGSSFEDNTENEFRPFNHFYDPVNDRPLTVLGTELGYTSPAWALEANQELKGTLIPLMPKQDYSYRDAMKCFYLALTSATYDERQKNWGCTFHLLGDVIHHIQDMAQPDHVRNDQHNDYSDSSLYEKYSNELTSRNNTVFHSYLENPQYPVPFFTSASEFWTTRNETGSDDFSTRLGLADFTNRNFVSKDTQFQYYNGAVSANAYYSAPAPNPALIVKYISDPDVLGSKGQIICDNLKNNSPQLNLPADPCKMEFVSTTVTDTYSGDTITNDRASSRSIFDKKLEDYDKTVAIDWGEGEVWVDRLFTLNHINFDAAHSFLIPRAVSYSAGLINHFFRGKIDAWPASNNHDDTYTNRDGWRIFNDSFIYDDIDWIDYDLEGLFKLYYWTYIDNELQLKPLPEAEWHTRDATTTGSLTPYEWYMDVQGPLTLPADLASNYIRLVFKGRIGSEGDPDAAYDSTNTNFSATGLDSITIPFSASEVIDATVDSRIKYFGITNKNQTLYVVSNSKLNTFESHTTLNYDLNEYGQAVNPIYKTTNYYASGSYNNNNDFVVVEYNDDIYYSRKASSFIQYGILGQNTYYPVPSNSLIASIDYGYRVHQLDYGAISKFPDNARQHDLSKFLIDHGYNSKSEFYSTTTITKNSAASYYIEDANSIACRIYYLSDINSSWPDSNIFTQLNPVEDQAAIVKNFIQTDILRRANKPICHAYF